MRRRGLGAVVIAAVTGGLLAVSGPAFAINSYNAVPAPERTEVGALVVQWDRDDDPTTPDVVRVVCSGTMISPDVFLTAAHCTAGFPEGARFYVSLAQDVQSALDAAIDAGLSPEQVADAVAVEGTAHWDPAFPGSADDSHDIAVITFDAEQAAELASRWSFTPAMLPTESQLSTLGSRALDAADWTVVGYGSQEAVRGPGGHVHPGGGVRMKAPVDFNALSTSWVWLSQIAPRGYGGACYGDSGGPNFVELDGQLILAAITITGDVPCYATNVAYRLDTASARTFLAQYVTLP